jgi:hypothetical protein
MRIKNDKENRCPNKKNLIIIIIEAPKNLED